MNHHVCPAPTEELTIEQILTRTEAMSKGEWVAAIGSFQASTSGEHVAIGVAGSTKAIAVFGPIGADDEDESIANAEMFVHTPRLRRELIALREQESDDLTQARADYDRACEKLTAIRSGMIALYDRYHALHICASRYLKEWPNETPKGWSLDELEACLEEPLPQLVPAIDPDAACQRHEEIEDWVVGCKGSLYAVVFLRLLAQGEELTQLQASLHEASRRIAAGFKLISLEGCGCDDPEVKLGEHDCFAGKMENALKGGTA